jgi:hypothetical protein
MDNTPEQLLARADTISKDLFGRSFAEMMDKEQIERAADLMHATRHVAVQLGLTKIPDTFYAHIAAGVLLMMERRIIELETKMKEAGVSIPPPNGANYHRVEIPYPIP